MLSFWGPISWRRVMTEITLWILFWDSFVKLLGNTFETEIDVTTISFIWTHLGVMLQLDVAICFSKVIKENY